MAPEYVVRGKLTEKADVYSFGVLVIEIVYGKRNNAFDQDSCSILQMVNIFYQLYQTNTLTSQFVKLQFLYHSVFCLWKKVWNLYGTGRLSEAVDPTLDGNFQEEEASQLLQIGLLCVQASAELRPAMSVVVKMLTNSHEILQPTQPPPFLNPGSSSEISSHSKPVNYSSQAESCTQSSGNSMTQSWIEPR